jgi:ribosomal protein S4E
MKITSRVVCIEGKAQGQTGTITDYQDGIVYVALDNGESIGCTLDYLLPIDDISNIGNIKFEKGMKIYDAQLNKVGEIIEVEQVDDAVSHTVRFEDGKVLTYPLFEEFCFIVVE